MALPASGLLIAASQPPNPNRGLGGGGAGWGCITLTKGALPTGYMDYGIQD